MDLPKRSRIPTRVSNIHERSNESPVKENLVDTSKPRYELRRGRILSDSVLLPPLKKVKTTTRSKIDIGTMTSRPPLGDLNKNIATVITTALGATKKTVQFPDLNKKKVSEPKREPKKLPPKKNSVSKPQTGTVSVNKTQVDFHNKETFTVDTKNVTIRRPLTPYHKSFSHTDSNLDEVFIDAAQYFLSFKSDALKQSKCLSPILPNAYKDFSTVIFQGIPEGVLKPARKRSLVKTAQRRSGYVLDTYTNEYLDDLIYHQLKNEWKYVLKINFFKVHNPCNVENRTAVVNWLIQAHDYLDLSPTVLFSTIRLFDKALEHIPIACNMCQLVGLVIMWMIQKFDNANSFIVNKLVLLCKKAYSPKEFLVMEIKLLKFFDYNLYFPDVTTYASYYLSKLQLSEKSHNALLLNCTLYIVECYALSTKFSTVIPSIQAASALCLALEIVFPSMPVWQHLKDAVGYYTREQLEEVMQDMKLQLHKVQDPTYEYRQPYHKYASKDKAETSIILLRKLVAS